MSRSVALWTSAVVVLGAAAWFLLRREAERDVVPGAPPSDHATAPGLAPAPAGGALPRPAEGPASPTSARALRGSVLRDDGGPAAGASVTAFPLGPAFAGGDGPDASRRAVADAAGRFAFEDPPSGSFGVHARLEGAGSASIPFVRVEARGDTTVTLRLAGDRGIAGRVEDLEGEPVAGARVATDAAAGLRRLYRELYDLHLHPRIDVVAVTGPDGRFALPALEPAAHDVAVVAPGFLPATTAGVAVPTTDLVVRLAPGARITGVVSVGSPVPPATVRVWTEPPSVEARPAVAGAEAAFLLDGLRPGSYRVLASAPGCTRDAARVEVRAGETPDPVRLALRAGTLVCGGVRSGDDGAAIPDAEVSFGWIERHGHGWSTSVEGSARTDGRGAWSAPLRPGEWTVNASKPGWSAPESGEDPPPVVVGDDPVRVDLVLVPAPCIEGIVLFDDGPPVPGARVWISGMGTNPLATTSGPIGIGVDDTATAGEDGRFRIEGAATYGRYSLTASGPGGARGTTEGVVFDAGATVTRARITIQRVAATGARVEGRVVDEGGSAIEGAVVRFAGSQAVTSADGTFALDAVPAGTYRARYGTVGRALGFSPPFAVGPRDTVRLPPWTLPREGVRVRGTLRTTDGRPPADAQVTVWFPLEGDFHVVTVAAGADGRYAAEGPALTEGTITIQARARDTRFVETRRDLPIAGEVDFRLGGYATATATVSFAGRPARVDAWLVQEGPEPVGAWIRAEWDEESATLRVGGIVPGRRRLRLTADGHAPIVTEVLEAREGETIPLGALRFTAGATFAGRILDADGKPWVGLQVNLDEPFLQVDTDAEGRFRMEHVPPGTWTVGFAGADAPRPSPTFTVAFAEGKTVEMERRLPR